MIILKGLPVIVSTTYTCTYVKKLNAILLQNVVVCVSIFVVFQTYLQFHDKNQFIVIKISAQVGIASFILLIGWVLFFHSSISGSSPVSTHSHRLFALYHYRQMRRSNSASAAVVLACCLNTGLSKAA